MKKYTKNELAVLIQAVILKNYSNPEYLYEQLKSNINRKSKAINKKDLTENEYKEKGIKIAEAITKELHLIRVEIIESKLSDELVDAASEGIELSDYKDYVLKFAKDRVRELINFQYKKMQNQVKQMNKKRKR